MRTVSPTAVLAAVLLCGAANGAPPAGAAPLLAAPSIPAAPTPGMDRYLDPANGWSISYPPGWRVEGGDPALVQIRDPENQALVAVRVAATELPLNAAASQILAAQEQYLTDNGRTWAQTSRQLISYPNGTTAVDIRGDILPGGRSHQLYFLRGGRAFVVNAETTVELWDKFSADFARILLSFALPA